MKYLATFCTILPIIYKLNEEPIECSDIQNCHFFEECQKDPNLPIGKCIMTIWGSVFFIIANGFYVFSCIFGTILLYAASVTNRNSGPCQVLFVMTSNIILLCLIIWSYIGTFVYKLLFWK